MTSRFEDQNTGGINPHVRELSKYLGGEDVDEGLQSLRCHGTPMFGLNRECAP